jgi:hypothetical protein
MNSLPFISHHLFVAAVGNDSHARERPAQQERNFVGTAEPASAITLEVMDGRKPLLASASRPLRTSVAQARG